MSEGEADRKDNARDPQILRIERPSPPVAPHQSKLPLAVIGLASANVLALLVVGSLWLTNWAALRSVNRITPPTPMRSVPPQAAKLLVDLGDAFSADRYPAAARRAGAQGRVGMKLTIDHSGRVADCEITSSSGNADLDQTSCGIAIAKLRYAPARDAANQAIESRVRLGVKWQLQGQ